MDDEAPKPMKKVHRNIFHKVGKKLEKFEQSLGAPSPNLSHGFASTSDLSSSSHHTSVGNHEEQDDTLSLQYLPHDDSDSPKAIIRHKHANRSSYPHTFTSSDDTRFSGQWRSSTDESVQPIAKDSSTQYDRETKILCQDLIDNKSVNLYVCREYDKKISLLRNAVSFNTPKVTIPVILFLKNSLSEPIFYELLKRYPSVVNNYINLAKLQLQTDYYVVMLKQFNKNDEIAMIHLRQASQQNDFQSKITLLNQAAVQLGTHPWWYSQIGEYQHLLHKQRELQRSLTSSQSTVELENHTTLETYKIVYDNDFRRQKYRHADKTQVDRSKELETSFNLSPEMIMCARLSVIMQCGLRMHYEDFLHQAMHQNFFSKKYIIAPENFADMVYNWVRLSGEGQEKASEKIERFLNMIPDAARRLYYAEKFHNYDVAMDTIANVLRDRVQLEHLRKRMPPNHPSYNRATALLETTKWRN